MSWLHYLIEANIYLGVFYLCYCLFLNRDTHYMLGRAYLIFSCVVAFILPVTLLSMLKPVVPEIVIEEPVTQVNIIPANIPQIKLAAPVKHFTFDDALIYLYIAGVVIAFCVLLFRLRKLYILTRNKHSVHREQYKVINLDNENTAFSFFNYLFIGSNVPQAETIIAHELVHIRQKHSVDIIFLEIVRIVNWFNPFIYLIQRSLKTIHEYIADEQTAAHEHDALAYSSFLLNNAYGIQGSSIAHSFFNYNLLKKRIIMLNKNRSGKLARLKYLAALPLCAGMLCASTLVFSKDYGLIDLAPRKVVKPVIDSVKYALKLTEIKTNMWQISDKIGFTDKKNGSESFYTVNSLTEKDKADFKKRGFEIAIVEREKAKPDTAFAVRPPAKIGKDGSTVQENGYLINKTKEYFTVTITDKAGNERIYNSTDATPAERKMLMDKYNYKFFNYDMKGFFKRASVSDKAFSTDPNVPPPPPPVVVPDKPAKKIKSMPPPPPPAMEKMPKAGKMPPPPVIKLDKPLKANMPPQPPPAIDRSSDMSNVPPPPPIPYDPVYKNLIDYMTKHTRYPAVAYDNKLNGHVILSFVISNEHKITDVKIEKGMSSGCSEEAARALKSYSDVVNASPGMHKIAVTFMLANNAYTKFYAPKPLGTNVVDKSNFVGQVMITGIVK
jgi:beta-lactamase regulating signal transducer with metallopeptidase domain